jgi:uncharacterized metal-binding protein
MESKVMQSNCLCESGEKIVVACSGACDLGLATDRLARTLRDAKLCKMNCLAAVGAGIQPTIEMFKSSNLLLIDGCSVDCGKKILDQAGIAGYHYVRMTDLGYVKGETPVTDELIHQVFEKVKLLF